MEGKGAMAIAKQVFAFLKATALRRFFVLLVTLGVGMLTLTWVDVLLYLLPMIRDFPKEKLELPVTLVAVSLIAIGIVGFIHDVRSTRKAEEKQRAEEAAREALRQATELAMEQKRNAASLISALRAVVRKFPVTDARRDPTYGNVEIMAVLKAAGTYLANASARFAGNSVIGLLSKGDIDVSKQAPFMNVTLGELEDLANALGAHYEID